MAFSLVTPVVDPIGPEGALVSALSRDVEPFVATPLGYDTVMLSWKMPDSSAWDGIRITRSRSGFPRTYDDGMDVVLFESEDWYTRPAYHDFHVLGGDGRRAPIGGYHYFSIFLKNAFGWIKVSEQDALVPYDFNSTDRLWDTIPEYYKNIRDDTADISLVNLRINADLYDNVAGGSAPNTSLSGFLHLFGWGFDILRTQTDYLKNGYDPSVIHPERLKLLARQFGYEPEVAVPAHVNRTILRNLAVLYRKRGTMDGIKDTVTAMSGWDADVYLGYNRLLSKEMTALTAPEIPEWDPTVRYPVGTLVKRNNWIYISTQVSLGDAQAPPTTASSNARWTYNAYPTYFEPLNGDVWSWQARMDGVGTNDAYITGYTKVASGVPDPANPTKITYNALMTFRGTAVGTNGANWVDVLSVPGIGSGSSTKERVVKYGVPIPKAEAWSATKAYHRGDVVIYSGSYYVAEDEVVGVAPNTVGSSAWRDTAPTTMTKGVPLNLSFVAHGPFVGTAGTGGKTVRARIRTYDKDGVLLDDLTGSAVTSGGVGQAWAGVDYYFQPHADAVFLAYGARVEAMPAQSGNTWDNAHYFTNFQLEVSQDDHLALPYEHPRQVKILVKPDKYNMFRNPSFEGSGLTDQVVFTNLAMIPRGTAHGSGVAGSFWNDRYPTFTTYAYDVAITGSPGGLTTGARLTVTGTQAGLGWTIAENPEVATPGADARMFAVTPGEYVTVSHWVKASVATGWQVGVRFASAGAWVGAQQATNHSLSAGAWLRVSHTVQVPSGVTRMACYSINTGGAMAVGATVDATGLQVTKTPRVIDYFDGTSRDGRWNHADFNTAWVGTTNNSNSRLRATFISATPSRAAPVKSSLWAKRGTYSMRLIPTISLLSTYKDTYVEFDLKAMGCVEGKTYTIRAVLRQNGPTTNGTVGGNQDRNLFIVIAGGGGSYRGLVSSLSQANVAGEYEHKVTFTVPKVAGDPVTTLGVRFYSGQEGGAEDVFWDEVTLVEGTEVGEYIDGTLGDDYIWETNTSPPHSRSFYYENRLDRTEAMRRALRDSTPLAITVSEPQFGVWTG